MKATSDLIDLIYAAGLGEAGWPEVLKALAEGVPDGRTTMFYHDASINAGGFSLTHGFSETEVASYNATWASLNPWMPGASRRPVGKGVVADQMLDPARLRMTAFHDGFLSPLGAESATGITIDRDVDRSFMVSVLTSRADPEANLGHAALLTAVAPHLRRVVRYHRRFEGLSEIGRAALDALGVGVIVVGEGGRARTVSALAGQMMEGWDGVSVGRGGRIRSADAGLEDVLRAMLASPHRRTWTTVVAAGGRLMRVMLVRIRSDELSDLLQGPTVILLLEPCLDASDRSAPDGAMVAALAALHGLTEAETAVLCGIASGRDVASLAAARGVSAQTVRGQLKDVFAKTGSRRQSDLVRLVLAHGRPPFGGC